MASNRRSLLSMLLLTTALVAVPLSTISLSAPPQTPSKEFSIARMGLAGVNLGTKAFQVQRKLGKPQQIKSENSRCCGVLLRWQYPEVEVRLEVPEGANQERNATVYSISTRSAKVATLEGIRVGDRKSKVLRVYGMPGSTESDRLLYANNQYASSLVFRFENDRVVEIIAASQLN